VQDTPGNAPPKEEGSASFPADTDTGIASVTLVTTVHTEVRKSMSNTRRCPGDALIWMTLKHRIRARPYHIHYHPRFPTSAIPTAPLVSQIDLATRYANPGYLQPTTTTTTTGHSDDPLPLPSPPPPRPNPESRHNTARARTRTAMRAYCDHQRSLTILRLRLQRRIWVTIKRPSLSSSGAADAGLAQPGAKTKANVAGTLSRVRNRVVWAQKAEKNQVCDSSM